MKSCFRTESFEDGLELDANLLTKIREDRKKDSAATSDRTRLYALGIIGAILTFKEKGILLEGFFFIATALAILVLFLDYLQYGIRYLILADACEEGKKLLRVPGGVSRQIYYYDPTLAFRISRIFFKLKFYISIVTLIPFLWGIYRTFAA